MATTTDSLVGSRYKPHVLTPAEVEYQELLGLAALLIHLGAGECRSCILIGDGFGPSHEASSRCESGGHAHCTCDTCF